MSDKPAVVSRPLVGLVALVCLVAALALWIWLPNQALWYGSFLRVGILMVVFWIALPSRGREAAWSRISPWVFVGIIAAAFLLPRFKHVIIPVIVIVVIAAVFLRPRSRQRPPGPSSDRIAR